MTRLLPLLFALLLLPACSGPAEPEPTPSKTKSSKAKDDKPDFPREPLAIELGDLAGEDSLSVGKVKVTSHTGEVIKLKEVLADRTLLVYLPNTPRDKQTKSATRLLRKVVQSGRGMGFRMVIVFPEGTEVGAIRTFLKKRHLGSHPRGFVDHDGAFAEATGWAPRSAALLDSKGNVGAFFGPSDRWDSRLGFEGGLTSDILALAWALPDPGPQLDQPTREAAVAAVKATVAGADADLSALGQKAAYGVWVSLFRAGQTTRLRGRGDGKLGKALVAATQQALAEADPAWAADPDLRIQIDVSGKPGDVPTRYLKSLWYLIEPGIHGVILGDGDGAATMLPSEPVSMGYLTPRVRGRNTKLENLLGRLSREAGQGKAGWQSADTKLRRFRTTSFGTVTGDSPVVSMARGNVPLPPEDPSEAAILESIRTGGLWLANTVKDDGKFDYEYFPNKDQGSKGYNIVRHAGSVYGLFEMHHLSGHEPALTEGREIYLERASRAMGYIYDALAKPRGAKADDRMCLVDKGRCESGSAALTLLTFLVRPEPDDVPAELRSKIFREDDAAVIEGLGLVLLDMIDADGKVFRRYAEATSLPKVKKEPLYYPGEAMLALLTYYEKTGDERWLNGARAIAKNQMKDYKKDRFITPDHWVMQGLYRLWRIDKTDDYANSAYAMAVHYCSELYPNVFQPFPDYKGSWRRTNDTPRTTRAGSRSEALRAVMHLAWERGDDAALYEDTLVRAARHLMEQQYTERNSYWVPDLARVHGAYPMGVVDNHIRIDNNQHALVGITGALEAVRHRAGK